MLEVKVRANPYVGIRKGHYRPRPKAKPKPKPKPALPAPPSPPEPRWDGLYVGPRGQSVYFFRAEADAPCPDCQRPYDQHPEDPHEGDLVVLCNGWHVKLPGAER